MQEERGENGTPHIQGFIHYKNAVALSTLKSWNPRIHWEQARSIVNSVKYCSDPTKRHGQIWTLGFDVPNQPRLHVLDRADLFTWQLELANELDQEPNDRSITWYYDQDGGSGKTSMAKFIVATYQSVLFLSGGSFKDTSYQVIKMKTDPRIVVVNLPRTSEGKVSYSTLESVKDGLIQSGKYEGGFRLYAPPHVIVMSNFLPDMNALSMDRWQIRYLENNRRLL